MKRVLKVIILFILLGANLLANQPEWWLNISKPNSIIGYGESKNRKDAIILAREEIVNTLSVNIVSDYSITTRLNNDDYSHQSNSIVKSTSSLDLISSKLIKSININGVWYIAVEYSTLPTVYKLEKTIVNGQSVEPSYLNFTNFGLKLYNILNYHIKLNIFRKDNLWYIQANDSIDSTIQLTENDLLELFLEKNRDNLNIPNVLYHNDKLYFNFKSSKKYKTLLSLESDGRVGVIASNITNNYFPNNQTMIINNFSNKTIYEMFILIDSDEKIDTYKFEKLHEEVLDSSNFKFDELIYILNEYNFSSILIKIKEK